jgi:hypothetical protein
LQHCLEKYVFKGATGQAKLARALAARENQLICMSGIIGNIGLFFMKRFHATILLHR